MPAARESGAVDGVRDDGHDDRDDRAPPLRRPAAEAPGTPDPLGRLNELRRDRQGDRDRDGRLVQRRRDAPQRPARVRQCVRRAEAQQHDDEPQRIVEAVRERLGRHGAAQPDGARRPRGQVHLRQPQHDRGPGPRAHHDLEHQPHHQHEPGQREVHADRSGPGVVRAAQQHYGGHAEAEQHEQQRVRRQGRRRGHPDRPPPPRPRMDAAAGGPHRAAACPSSPGQHDDQRDRAEQHDAPGDQGPGRVTAGGRGRRGRGGGGRRGCGRGARGS